MTYCVSLGEQFKTTSEILTLYLNSFLRGNWDPGERLLMLQPLVYPKLFPAT